MADYTWGNFRAILLGNFFEQCFFWALSHREWVTHFYLDILDRPWALCLAWLPVDGKIVYPQPMVMQNMCLLVLINSQNAGNMHVNKQLVNDENWSLI